MHRTLPAIFALTALTSACSGGSDSAAGDAPCQGHAGGAFSLTQRAEMLYSLEFTEGGGGEDIARIEAVIVGRGAPGWKTANAQPDSAARAGARDTTGLATSATMGAVRMAYDRRAHAAVIGDQRIPLDSFNVVLVENVDRAGASPTIGQRLRVAPEFPIDTGVCQRSSGAANLAYVDSLRARLMRNAEVRAFAAP